MFCTITILFQAYSLISLPIPESTPYNTNDSFGIYSHHYQRLEYSIFFAILLASIEIFGKDFLERNIQPIEQDIWEYYAPALHIANLVTLILQILGILGNPMVTLVYLLEQISIFLLGSTSRATDSRVILSFVLDSGFAIIFALFAKDNKVIWVLPYFASRNLIFGTGLKKSFSIVNEELEK